VGGGGSRPTAQPTRIKRTNTAASQLENLIALRLARLFLTLPTRGLTGQQVISSDRWMEGSFKDLVGAAEQRQRYSQSKRLHGTEIDHQFEFYHLLDR